MHRFLYRFTDDAINRNVNIQTLLNASPKPSFLLWDKVYQKVNYAQDELWLLHTSEKVLSYFANELSKKGHAW